MILIELLWTFFKIGAFTFGGGYAMLPLIQSEVLKNGWISPSDLVDFIAISESTPGPFAVNISTYIGAQLSGIAGAFCGTLGVVLPSFLIILIVARSYERFKNSLVVRGCMSGLKPAVIGMIASAILSVGKTVFFPDGFSGIAVYSLCTSALIFFLMLILVFRKLHPILIILLSAALGIAFGHIETLFIH